MVDSQGRKPVGFARFGIVFGTMLAVMVQALDSTIATVALPHMQGSLSASQDEINWVITSYITAVAIMTAPAGWLADRYGRKLTLLVAVAGFTIASVLTGAAQTLDQVVLFRILQGAFGAPLVPLAQSILLDAYEPKDALRAMSWWSLGGIMGPILGPNLGGWLTENWDWRWVFFINVPLGIVCFGLLAAFLPETRTQRSSFDWFGFAALSLAIGAFQLVMDRGSGQDWFDSREIIVEACLAGLGLYAFIVHSLTTKKTFIDFGTLRDWNFACGNVFSFLFSTLFITGMVLLPSYLQNIVGDPVGLSGSLMTPRSIGSGTAVILMGRIGPRLNPRFSGLFGLLVVAYSMYAISEWNVNVSSLTVATTGLIQGLGSGIASVSMQGITFAKIAPARRNGAVSVYALTRNIGQSIGVAAVTALLVRNTQLSHADISAYATPFNHALGSGAAGHFWNLGHTATRAALDVEVGKQASLIAYSDDFRILTFLALASIPSVFLLRIPRRPKPLLATPEGAV